MLSVFRSSQVDAADDDADADEQQQTQQPRPAAQSTRRPPPQAALSSSTPATRRPGSASGRRSTLPTPGANAAQSSSALTLTGGAASAASSSSSTRHLRGVSTLDQASVHKNFKVVVRIRPPLPRELDASRTGGAHAYRDIVRTEERNKAVSICENGLPSGAQSDSGSGGLYAQHKFTFDHVYDQEAQQVEVYTNTAREAVMSTLQGYNSTVLAYGQTGTGKTFTMEGFDDSELRGIIPRSVEEIFNYIQTLANNNVRFLVRASYLQIYNEVISDLLKPERTNLSIREDKKRGVFVEGLSEWVVRSPKEVYGLIKRGTSLRATGSTRINETSSRSHALFIIIVEQNEMIYEEGDSSATGATPPAANATMDEQERGKAAAGSTPTLIRQSFKVGKLNLVDLAGSERVRISGAKGSRLLEAQAINQSLSALGNVISALTEGNRSHIPYRDSKLTFLLANSFGGNVKCTLLAMISPAQESFLESLSTLKFANRAKNIKNEAKINEDLDEKALLRRYERELKKLRQELQAKSKNVVDKRRLIEVEEQRRRAEQDKMQALMNMEKLSRDLLTEKNQKKKLEERIKEMNSQLLVGGHLTGQGGGAGGAGGANGNQDSAESQQKFQQALQVEQDRIRQQYSAKLADLERERESMEEEKAQTSRYKQLLLKQRDIMIQLTARLNERDQSILLLQEELDAYDRHQRAMEDELDQKRHRLIQLQRMNVNGDPMLSPDNEPSSPTSGGSGGGQSSANLYGLFPIDEAPYFEEHTSSPSPNPRSLGQQQRSNDFNSAPPVQSFPASQAQGADSQAIESEISRRVAAELSRRDGGGAGKQLAALEDALSRRESEALRLREELAIARNSGGEREFHHALQAKDDQAASLAAQNFTLQQQLASLQAMLQAEKSDRAQAQMSGGGGAESSQLKSDMLSLRKKYDVQLQERAALKVILEKKMKSLIDSIAAAALGTGAAKTVAAGAGAPASSPTSASKDAAVSLPSRTRREIEVLQRLVEASLTALKNSDGNGDDAPSASSSAAPSALPSPSPTAIASRSFAFPAPALSSAPSALQAQPRLPSARAMDANSAQQLDLLMQQRKAELARLDERLR